MSHRGIEPGSEFNSVLLGEFEVVFFCISTVSDDRFDFNSILTTFCDEFFQLFSIVFSPEVIAAAVMILSGVIAKWLLKPKKEESAVLCPTLASCSFEYSSSTEISSIAS